MSRLEVMLRDFMCYIRNVLHEGNKIDQGNGQTSKHIALPFLQSMHRCKHSKH
jgi:hypothetical protein